MKKIVSLVLIILGVGIAFASCSQKNADNVAYWTCPMHPEIHAEGPGQCPICGMDLVPVNKNKPDAHTEHNSSPSSSSQPEAGQPLAETISLDAKFTQVIGVKTSLVKMRALEKNILAYGKVAHDRDLWVAQNELIEALKLGDAKLIQAIELKLSYMGLSKEWIDDLKSTRRVDQSLHLNPNNGAHYFEANVSQDDIGLVKVGLPVDVIDTQGRLLTTAKVKAIGALIDMNSRSVRILVESDTMVPLKPNTFAQFKIHVDLGERLSLPHSAVLFNGDATLVYAMTKGNAYEMKNITLGASAGDYDEILEGAAEGETVVSNGHFLIDAETQLKLGASGGHKH